MLTAYYDRSIDISVSSHIENIVGFIDQYLFDRSLADRFIEVIFEYDEEMEVVDGFCTQDDNHSFTIQLHPNLDDETFDRTILHELVHVHQYSIGTLGQYHISGSGPRVIWKGEDITDCQYDDRPCEIEARQLEEQLYKHFLQLTS